MLNVSHEFVSYIQINMLLGRFIACSLLMIEDPRYPYCCLRGLLLP